MSTDPSTRALAVAAGVIDLAMSAPPGPPDFMVRAAAAALAAYPAARPPSAGLAGLRGAVADQRGEDYGTHHHPEREVLVTTGATEAVTTTLSALCDRGDDVLALQPCTPRYAAAAALAGVRLNALRLVPGGDGFTLDVRSAAKAVTSHTRLVLVESPHGPTGHVLTIAELASISDLCRRHGLLALSVEVHEQLVYDGATHLPLAALPGMRNRTLSVSSAASTFGVAGWRVGWICGPAALVAAVARTRDGLTAPGGAAYQAGVAHGLRGRRPWVDDLRTELQRRREHLCGPLRAAGAGLCTPRGGLGAQVEARSFGYVDSGRLCQDLPVLAGVLGQPATDFHWDGDAGRRYVRFTFGAEPALLATAARRLADLVRRLPADRPGRCN